MVVLQGVATRYGKSSLISVLLVVAVTLSGPLPQAQVANGNGNPDVASPAFGPAAAAKSKRDHQQDRKRADRKQNRKDENRKPELTHPGLEPSVQGREGDWRDFCDDPESVKLTAVKLCTHGPDDAPPAYEIDRDVPLLSARAASLAAADIACDGDGQSGFRVQVLYVHGSDRPTASPQSLESIRGWAGDADQTFRQSALETGGTRSLRFVQDGAGAGCQPNVTDVTISPGGDNSFSSTINELNNQGFDRNDRIYLLFVDANVYCGVGTVWGDDRASSDNWNNAGPSYSRVDSGCWSGHVAAHELMHNLGGVQDSAPNTSHAFHCIDEWDVMCYSDAPNYPSMHYVCQPQSMNDTELDCRHDDYYNTSPQAGSYLATCWNPANNQFLIGAAVLPAESSPCVPAQPSDLSPPTASTSAPGAVQSGHGVSIEATASDNVGVASVAFGVCAGSSCAWDAVQPLGEDAEAPYTASWTAPKQGSFTFLAKAIDQAGNQGISEPVSTRVIAKDHKHKHKGKHKKKKKH